MSLAVKGMELGQIISKEVTQTQRDKCLTFSLVKDIQLQIFKLKCSYQPSSRKLFFATDGDLLSKVSIAVMSHHNHGNAYDRKLFIEANLQL